MRKITMLAVAAMLAGAPAWGEGEGPAAATKPAVLGIDTDVV